MNPTIHNLDLSYNHIDGQFLSFAFYTPQNATLTDGSSCQCIPSPATRSINFIANRITQPAINVYEITGSDFFLSPLITPQFETCPNSPNWTQNLPILFPCLPWSDPSFGHDNGLEIECVPQDFDDCAAGTHLCSQLCVNGWFPALNYTCGCFPGYTVDANHFTACIQLSQNLALIIGLAVGIPIVVLIALFAIAAYIYYKVSEDTRQKNLLLLPKDISWSFLEYLEGAFIPLRD